MRREHLKTARATLGLTALDLGERAAIKEEKIFAVERGRYMPTRFEASRWASVLGMPPAQAFPEIFGDTQGGAQ